MRTLCEGSLPIDVNPIKRKSFYASFLCAIREMKRKEKCEESEAPDISVSTPPSDACGPSRPTSNQSVCHPPLRSLESAGEHGEYYSSKGCRDAAFRGILQEVQTKIVHVYDAPYGGRRRPLVVVKGPRKIGGWG
eukprot:754453-Hanusia_phi.AAC.2